MQLFPKKKAKDSAVLTVFEDEEVLLSKDPEMPGLMSVSAS